MSHDDFAIEPIPGLPERPPQGEEILWQGRPNWWALAKSACGVACRVLRRAHAMAVHRCQ